MIGMIISTPLWCKKNMEITQRGGISMPHTPPVLDPARETPIEQVFNTTFWDEQDFPSYQRNNALKSAIRELSTFFQLSAGQQDEAIEKIRIALDQGADPNLLMTEEYTQQLFDDPQSPVTPLCVAIAYMVPRAVKVLLENGAQKLYFLPNGQEINITPPVVYMTMIWATIPPHPSKSVQELKNSYASLSLLVPNKIERLGLLAAEAVKTATSPTRMAELNDQRKAIYAVLYPETPSGSVEISYEFFILLIKAQLERLEPD
jgi:hypothetical protein